MKQVSTAMFERLRTLRDEYFNKLTDEELCYFNSKLDRNKQSYSSDELINMLKAYEDALYGNF